MKRAIISILFLIVIINGYSQQVFRVDRITDGRQLYRVNYLGDLNFILELDASTISPDSLTFNSTADTVLWSSNDTVVFDGSNEVVIGNSVRVGSPTSGIILQALDTLGSSDSVVFDQTFAGSVGDEYFWGGVDKWYDQRGNEYNAIQTTGINMPKLIWFGTDTVAVNFDGINDVLVSSVTFDIGQTHTIAYCVEMLGRTGFGQGFVSSSTNLYERWDNSSGQQIQTLRNDGTNTVSLSGAVIDLLGLNDIAETFDGESDLNVYVNGTLYKQDTDADIIGTKVITSLNIGNRIFANTYLKGNIRKLYIYTRILSVPEIQAL